MYYIQLFMSVKNMYFHGIREPRKHYTIHVIIFLVYHGNKIRDYL